MSTPIDRAIAYATERGRADGLAAASWYEVPTGSGINLARLIKGIDDGDPAILDTFPTADLSGEWADSLTGPALVEAAIVNADDWTMTRDEWTAYWSVLEPFNDICDAYEIAFSDAAAAEIERVARYHAS